MSQSVPPEQPESTPESTPAAPATAAKPAKSAKSFRQRLPRVSRRRGVALGAAVVLVGGAAVGVVAVAHHDHGGRGDQGRFAAERGRAGGTEGDDGMQHTRGEARGNGGRQNDQKAQGGQGGPGSQGGQSGTTGGQSAQPTAAPLPVPAVSAATAIATAGKAVSGGKPDALRVVAQQGGGSAWEVEVLGADGVRHLVTIDGATGAVTGNTVASAGS